MAEALPREVSPWAGLARSGRFGASAGEAGVVLAEVDGGAALLICARGGRDSALLAAAKAAGIDLPVSPKWLRVERTAFMWAGPGQWLARAAGTPDVLRAELASVLANAFVIDQSHARAIVTVSGPRARDTLAKGIDIDLHPRAFRPGDVALTTAAHVPALILQLDDRPSFELSVPRSFAGSVWHWLTVSAAEYGYRVGKLGETA